MLAFKDNPVLIYSKGLYKLGELMDNNYIYKRYKLYTAVFLKLLIVVVIYVFMYFLFHIQSRIKSLDTVTLELVWCWRHFDICQRWPFVTCMCSLWAWVADCDSYLYEFHIHTSPILSTAVSLETHFPTWHHGDGWHVTLAAVSSTFIAIIYNWKSLLLPWLHLCVVRITNTIKWVVLDKLGCDSETYQSAAVANKTHFWLINFLCVIMFTFSKIKPNFILGLIKAQKFSCYVQLCDYTSKYSLLVCGWRYWITMTQKTSITILSVTSCDYTWKG